MIFTKLEPELEPILGDFNSGNLYLDKFLKCKMAHDDSIGKTYLFLTDNKKELIGYYNIGMGSVEQIQNGNRYKIGGAVHINCFAIDRQYQDQVETITEKGERIYLSDLMLYDCMNGIAYLREQHIGIAFITLMAT